MTWIPRQKGWMGRPQSVRLPPRKRVAMPAVVASAVVIVPAFPAFSPAAIADLLQASRQSVYYWMTGGK